MQAGGFSPRPHLWEPARKVVHDDRRDQRLAQTRGQAHQRVGQQRGLRAGSRGQGGLGACTLEQLAETEAGGSGHKGRQGGGAGR